MIKITYNYYPDYTIRVEGHAGQAEKGKDIVCSACSMTILSLCNYCEIKGIDCRIISDDGFFLFVLNDTDNIYANFAFDFTIKSLQMLADNNSEFVRIRNMHSAE